MTWYLAFSVNNRRLDALSDHWTAQTAFDMMIHDAITTGRELRRYIIRGEDIDVRTWHIGRDTIAEARELVPYGFDSRNEWFSARYGTRSTHGNSRPVAYMAQATTLDRLLGILRRDAPMYSSRDRPSVTHIPSSLHGFVYPALRTLKVVR